MEQEKKGLIDKLVIDNENIIKKIIYHFLVIVSILLSIFFILNIFQTIGNLLLYKFQFDLVSIKKFFNILKTNFEVFIITGLTTSVGLYFAMRKYEISSKSLKLSEDSSIEKFAFNHFEYYLEYFKNNSKSKSLNKIIENKSKLLYRLIHNHFVNFYENKNYNYKFTLKSTFELFENELLEFYKFLNSEFSLAVNNKGVHEKMKEYNERVNLLKINYIKIENLMINIIPEEHFNYINKNFNVKELIYNYQFNLIHKNNLKLNFDKHFQQGELKTKYIDDIFNKISIEKKLKYSEITFIKTEIKIIEEG